MKKGMKKSFRISENWGTLEKVKREIGRDVCLYGQNIIFATLQLYFVLPTPLDLLPLVANDASIFK